MVGSTVPRRRHDGILAGAKYKYGNQAARKSRGTHGQASVDGGRRGLTLRMCAYRAARCSRDEKTTGSRTVSLTGTVDAGLSPQRWRFWLKRLEDIGMLHESEPGMSELAGQKANSMMVTVRRLDTVMKRDLVGVEL
jgi:hypothetical protein